MSPAQKDSSAIKKFIISVSLFSVCTLAGFAGYISTTYLQNSQFPDTVNTNTPHVGSQNKSGTFFRTDSIFSLRSPKGYIPSLVHNLGEQAAAPVHFKTKQWIYTGVAAGITTALFRG